MNADARNLSLSNYPVEQLQLSIRNIEAIYFGSIEPNIFGWIHHAPAASLASMGVVLCSPFGYEAVCSHRTLRHLARSISNLGMPCIRFDYHSSGDSAGDENEAHQVFAWLSSIHAACEALKQRTGVRQIYLLGIRFGALLAAHVVNHRNDIAGLIAIAPVTWASFRSADTPDATIRARAYRRDSKFVR